jgi:hypothetical protein
MVKYSRRCYKVYLDSGAVPDASTTSTLGNIMTTRIKMKGGDEFDALSKKSKKYYHWKPGERKKIKRSYNKRLRKCISDGGEIGFDR